MKQRLLVVDDELSIALTLKAVLDVYGFEVETALSAEDSVSKLKAGSYDLVLTDMKMENDRSGYDVLRAARNTDYRPAVAIFTAYPSLGKDWEKEGAQCLFPKPMNTTDLVQQINAVLIAREKPREKLSSDGNP